MHPLGSSWDVSAPNWLRQANKARPKMPPLISVDHLLQIVVWIGSAFHSPSNYSTNRKIVAARHMQNIISPWMHKCSGRDKTFSPHLVFFRLVSVPRSRIPSATNEPFSANTAHTFVYTGGQFPLHRSRCNVRFYAWHNYGPQDITLHSFIKAHRMSNVFSVAPYNELWFGQCMRPSGHCF